MLGSTDSNSRQWPQDFLCFSQTYCFVELVIFSSEHKFLFIPIGLYFIKRHISRVKTFHRTINKAWNLFNLPVQSPKNSTKIFVSRFLIGQKLLSIDQVLFSIDRTAIETSRDCRIIFLPFSIDQAKVSTDRKMLYFEFSLRKFDNLTFHFMKQYSPNSNIIITTYPCIYLYIQQDQPT